MFWLVVTLVVVLFVGMYCGFSVLLTQNTGSTAFKNNTIEDQRIEAREYLDIHIRCGSTIDELLRGVSPVSKIKTFPSKEITDDSAVLVRSLDDNYNEFKMESRIDGQTVSFWTRTGSQGLPSTQGPIPFIIYLSRSSKDQIPTKETSLLSRPEFNIAAPYIYSDLDWISSTSSDYAFGDISFEAHVLAKVQRVLDYVAVTYNNPPIIAYGEGWGSVIARNLGRIDDRVNLVITTKFPGDPGKLLEEQGFSLDSTEERLLESVYSSAEGRCFPSSISSFLTLMPKPHVYVGSSTPHAFYSVGQEELGSFIKEQYTELDSGENFRYLEGPSFQITNFEELVLTVYEFIWNYKIKDTSISSSSAEPSTN